MHAGSPMRAVVCAYHNVGVRCLAALLAHGVEVPLVVTHTDASGENIWFDSVAELCRRAGIDCLVLAEPDAEGMAARLRAVAPDMLFSFYFRYMLPPAILRLPARGAFNMHGSLLPRYRGRVPVNWAVLHGESETGATLHAMVEKPDAGDIYDQQAVPILPNDTAHDVFQKVTTAAEMVMCRVLPALLAGRASGRAQELSQGSYFSGRKPEDGRIDWSLGAWALHNLVRAVAPPYPGAFADVGSRRLRLLRTWWSGPPPLAGQPAPAAAGRAALAVRGDTLQLRCADGGALTVLDAELDGTPLTAANFRQRFGADTLHPV